MEIQQGDYCIAQVEDESGKTKNHFFRVRKIEGKEIEGVLEKNTHLKPITVSFKKKQIVLNLGVKPPVGSVFGFNVGSYYRGKKSHPDFGDVHFFVDLKEEEKLSLRKSLDRAASLLQEKDLGFVLNDNLVLNICPKKGKYAGWYNHSSGPDGQNEIYVSLADINSPEAVAKKQYLYVLVHELGHALHFNFVRDSQKLEAKWIELYNQSIGMRKVEAKECRAFLKSFLQAETDFQSWMSSFEEDEDKAKLRLILKWVREVKSLSTRELLFMIQDGQDLVDVWPNVDVCSKDLKPLVTEYACKNYKELFAESFALHMLGVKLPGSVLVLMEKSILYAQKNYRGQNGKERD
jgi:hypothetical protein